VNRVWLPSQVAASSLRSPVRAPPRLFQIIRRLPVEPELGRRFEPLAEQDHPLGGDCALTRHDLDIVCVAVSPDEEMKPGVFDLRLCADRDWARSTRGTACEVMMYDRVGQHSIRIAV
jgi:hypothetical protein